MDRQRGRQRQLLSCYRDLKHSEKKFQFCFFTVSINKTKDLFIKQESYFKSILLATITCVETMNIFLSTILILIFQLSNSSIEAKKFTIGPRPGGQALGPKMPRSRKMDIGRAWESSLDPIEKESA